MEGGPSTPDDWDCDLFKRVNILNAYTSKYVTYLFILWCCVSADGESMAEESGISQVLGEEHSTVAWPCLALC